MQKIDRHFKELTKLAFARYGFAHSEILGNWPEIIGDELAQVSAPERIRWPRRNADDATAREKTGGTLIVRASYGHGLQIQHQVAQIIERINGFYGYQAICDVKVIQGNLPSRQKPTETTASLSAIDKTRLHTDLADITDEPLKHALERLGKNALSAAAKRRMD